MDYCNAINPCNANLTCKSSDELSDDKKLYFCDGACPNGYNKYENGECVGEYSSLFNSINTIYTNKMIYS